jgi:hypothetical protein
MERDGVTNALLSEEEIRERLGQCGISVGRDHEPWIFANIDSFVNLTRGNDCIKMVFIAPHTVDDVDDDVDNDSNELFDKVGRGVGNLTALKNLYCSLEPPSAATSREVLARLLSHVRQNIKLNIHFLRGETFAEEVEAFAEEVEAFASAIRGHRTITDISIVGSDVFSFRFFGTVLAALSTLPALQSVSLCQHSDADDELDPGHLTELLRAPQLRAVAFANFDSTNLALCQATANTLRNGTAITCLVFYDCSFVEGGDAIIVSALAENTTLTSMTFTDHPPANNEVRYSTMGESLLSNSTLQELSITSGPALSPVFRALQVNTGLKTLIIEGPGLVMDHNLYAAMMVGLGQNSSLVKLQLVKIGSRDMDISLWCKGLSVLRKNTALKSLEISFASEVQKSFVSALRMEVVAMLEENESLESISIFVDRGIVPTVEEYCALLTALQQNTKLKTIRLLDTSACQELVLTYDACKQLASILRKNYKLEILPDFAVNDQFGDLAVILRLNGAGRRYLIQDKGSVSKGVEVLCAVNDDLNCVFFHMLENPSLCKRWAAETVVPGVKVS